MGSLTTLLFDVDGTLADTEEIHRQSFNTCFTQAGLDWFWSPELYGELLEVTGGKERIRHFLDTRLPDFEAPMNIDEYIAGLHAAKTDIYTRTMASGDMEKARDFYRQRVVFRDAAMEQTLTSAGLTQRITAPSHLLSNLAGA